MYEHLDCGLIKEYHSCEHEDRSAVEERYWVQSDTGVLFPLTLTLDLDCRCRYSAALVHGAHLQLSLLAVEKLRFRS